MSSAVPEPGRVGVVGLKAVSAVLQAHCPPPRPQQPGSDRAASRLAACPGLTRLASCPQGTRWVEDREAVRRGGLNEPVCTPS